jgi:hypothetical protein
MEPFHRITGNRRIDANYLGRYCMRNDALLLHTSYVLHPIFSIYLSPRLETKYSKGPPPCLSLSNQARRTSPRRYVDHHQCLPNSLVLDDGFDESYTRPSVLPVGTGSERAKEGRCRTEMSKVHVSTTIFYSTLQAILCAMGER